MSQCNGQLLLSYLGVRHNEAKFCGGNSSLFLVMVVLRRVECIFTFWFSNLDCSFGDVNLSNSKQSVGEMSFGTVWSFNFLVL